MKDGVKGNTLTVLYPALIQIVSWIVVEPLLIVFKVTIIYIAENIVFQRMLSFHS